MTDTRRDSYQEGLNKALALFPPRSEKEINAFKFAYSIGYGTCREAYKANYRDFENKFKELFGDF